MNDQTKTIYLNQETFKKTLDSAGDQPVFVDFFAEWCGPCRMASPVVDKLAEDYDGKAVIAKVDVDANPELSQDFGIMSIPTVMIFKRDEKGQMQVVEKRSGFPGEQGFRDMIDAHLPASK